MTIKAWVIVGSNTQLRVLEAAGHGEKLKDVEMGDEFRSLFESEAVMDEQMKNHDSKGTGSIRALDNGRTTKELVSVLKKKAGKDFDRLVVIAPPDFMGSFKKHADKTLDKYIYQTISKDISRNSHKNIEDYLEDDLFNSLTRAV